MTLLTDARAAEGSDASLSKGIFLLGTFDGMEIRRIHEIL